MPPAQDPYSSPPGYGQPPTPGQPPRVQSPQDQPPYDQPPHDQPPYGQPGGYDQPGAYGQPTFDQPGGYGPPPQPWVPQVPSGQPRTESKAIVALVCAIGSWVLFPVLPAIAGLLVGNAARRDIRASGGWLTGDGMVTAAKVVAWANIAVTLLGAVLAVLAVVLFTAES